MNCLLTCPAGAFPAAMQTRSSMNPNHACSRRWSMSLPRQEPLHRRGVWVNRLVLDDVLADRGFRREDAVGEMGEIRVAGGDRWPQEEVDKGIGFLDMRRILGNCEIIERHQSAFLGNSVIDFNPIICLSRAVARAKTVSGIANAEANVAIGERIRKGSRVEFFHVAPHSA